MVADREAIQFHSGLTAARTLEWITVKVALDARPPIQAGHDAAEHTPNVEQNSLHERGFARGVQAKIMDELEMFRRDMAHDAMNESQDWPGLFVAEAVVVLVKEGDGRAIINHNASIGDGRMAESNAL